MNKASAAVIVLAATAAAAANAQETDGNGADVFASACAACHANPAMDQVPQLEQLRAMQPGAVVNTLTNGVMQVQGTVLSSEQQIAVAEFVTGKPVDRNASFFVNRCERSAPVASLDNPDDFNGWGNGIANARYAKDGGLTAADLGNLELKWAFGYANVESARAQPTYVDGRLFVASENGEVHALDPESGCTIWSF